jgi:uncharacterized protein (DUF488 family)
MSVHPVVSVGYEGWALEALVDRLAEMGVTVVADVRLNAVSRKPGFSKRRLAAACDERGVRYEHLRGLGNPPENRAAFRAGAPGSREAYLARVEQAGRDDLDRLAGLVAGATVALLCVEHEHAICHRSCVADLLAARDDSLTVVLS